MRKGRASASVAFVLLSTISLWSAVKSTVLTETSGAASDRFGSSVSMSATTIVVGAPHAVVGGNVQGAVFVFVKNASGWPTTPTAILSEAAGVADDYFGQTVAISPDGGTVVVGAPNNGSGLNFAEGALFVFTKPKTGWVTTDIYAAELTNAGAQPGDNLGESVAINTSANTIVAGATQAFSFGPGAAYVFREPAAGWGTTAAPNAQLSVNGGIGGEDFGAAISIVGNGKTDTVVVGAPSASSPLPCSGCGVVYLFAEPASGWATATETAQLYSNVALSNARLGSSVSIGTVTIKGVTTAVVAAGASNAEINGNSSQGTGFVFVEPSTGWGAAATQTGQITATDGAALDSFGASVAVTAVSGVAYVMVGAPNKTVGNNDFQGEIYLFTVNLTTGASRQVVELSQGSSGAANDNLGWSIAFDLSSQTAVTGAPGATVGGNSYQGKAVVWQ